MGNSMEATESDVRESSDDRDVECDFGNGLILLQHYPIPEEVLCLILSFVDENSLAFKCRLVCRVWRELVQNLALRARAERILKVSRREAHLGRLSWVDYYWILHKRPLGRNLLKNNCGQDGFNHWEVISSGGDGWKVESTPHGTEALPPINSKGETYPDFMGMSSCFVTSYHSCSKEQTIELKKEGLTNDFMDQVQPPIQISEWTACRFDCGCVYQLEVNLLDKNKEDVKTFKARENFSGIPREIWYQVTHVLENYGPGVRFIRFFHGGVDTQFWKGHYGSKMSGGSVRVVMSVPPNTWDTPSD